MDQPWQREISGLRYKITLSALQKKVINVRNNKLMKLFKMKFNNLAELMIFIYFKNKSSIIALLN